jgi:arginase
MEELPVILSGDCLSAIGGLAGLQKCNIQPYLIWFDAHGDFHTPSTTSSGHLGGMPLAMITGRGDASLLKSVKMTSLPDSKVYLVGGRELDHGEKEALENSEIVMCNRITEILNILPTDANFWIHFDTDYINPIDAPAQRYPVSGGISAQQVKSDLEVLTACVKIVGLSVSAWAPSLDVNAQTAITCWNAISSLTKNTLQEM